MLPLMQAILFIIKLYDVQADGDDIAFSLGSMWLDHEIELFNKNYNGTHAELVAWVRIPEFSTSLDTYIRMYYGNATMSARENPVGVWDASYKGVWHLEESSGFTLDSTFFSENGLVTGTVIRPSNGQISNAYNYGTDGTFNVGDPGDGHLDFGTESFMVSMWINIDTSTGTWQIPLYKGASSTWDPGYCFATPTTGDSLRFHITDGTSNIPSPSASIDFDSWTYIVGIVDRTNNLIRIYKDGIEVGSGVDISGILSLADTQNLDFQCAHPTYDFDGLLDEVRVLNLTRSNSWIKTEYYNQYDPNSFYSIGQEQGKPGVMYSNLQVNAIDLAGNPIPSANISIYNQSILIGSNLTDSNGYTLFMNIIQAEYNFTASVTSDIGNHVEIVNITSEAIVINQTFQTINIICDISSNFFEIIDIDGIAVDSGWMIVGNSTHELQNCTIDGNGHTRFWWVDTLPYQYNYTVFYQDTDYNPQIIPVASGDITVPNSTIQVQASLTTVDFTVFTLVTQESVSGVKLLLTALNTGESIVNLTSDNDGKVTMRWLNSSGINGNYSLQLDFFGASRRFNMTSITQSLVTETNFTVSAMESYNIYIEISLENYETELISLNPTDYISVDYGSQLKLRILFNVSRAVGAEQLLGPTYSDLMSYKIFKGADLIYVGNLGIESDYIGAHSSIIDTKNLESDVTYLLFVTAQKSGYSIPQEILLQLSVLENSLILNQSQNDDSIQSVYWSESLDVSVKAYGEFSESFTMGTGIFQDVDHNLRFSLPNVNTNWNLTQITFNLYNISWSVNASDINISILDPIGVNRVYNISNHAGWDYNLGVWTGITISINQESPTLDNNFEFFISGTFDNTIDVIVDASFIRNEISTQYRKYNISNLISFISESEGWAIKNITFLIENCYNTLTWEKVNLSTLTNLNITTANGFKYSLNSGDENGNGVLQIDDKIIYPLDNQYLFSIESAPNTIFDVIIKVEYVQEFYQNQYLETLNVSDLQNNISNGGSYQISLTADWDEKFAVLLINDINNQIQYFSPSELAMNITIGGQTYSVSNTLPGQGIFSLTSLNKDSVYSAVIETNQPVNFTLSYKISYLRKITYETLGTVTYFIKESPDISGTINYYTSLGAYLQTIDTSLIDSGYYTISLEASKENYVTISKDLDFIVMNRLTLINGDSTLYRKIEFIYIKDAFNFTFLYTDVLTGGLITDLKTQFFMWEKYDIQGNVTDNGAGTLFQRFDGSLILDFDSETRDVGDYLLIVNLEKENYEYKNAMILLTIKTRFLSYSLSNNFENNQLSIVQGKDVIIQVNLTDPTRGGIPLLNASITLTINGKDYNFTEYINGNYSLIFRTYEVNAFFSSKTLTGIINITREDYFSEQFFITIVVEMEEIFPGMPTFYFLIIIFAILAVVGSIVGYRVYKKATIPIFIKNVREIKKEIKDGKEVSESLLYPQKEVFVGEIVRDKWSNIGLSMGDILGVEIKKSKKIPKIKYTEPKEVHDLKPLGLLLMKWDERIGVELLGRYPEDANMSEKALMQIYGTHEYSGEKGAITLIRGNLNVLSYYTGPETGYYIILILSEEDDPDMYEGAMANVAQLILQNIEDDVYIEMIPSIFQRLSVYPSLSYEQNLIFHYQDSVKQMIINILRDYGVITKSELIIWVRDRELEGIIDLEAILAELIKIELIKVASVKGIPSELIFLTKDIFMLRVPPDSLFKDPASYGLPTTLTKLYQEEVQNFFNDYQPTEIDTVKLLNSLINPEVYETVRLLRIAIVTMKDFEKLKNKGVSDIYGVLRKLWDINMIRVFKDENGVEYYTLFTDFHVNLIFPKYLLNVIKVLNDQKSKSDKVLIQYLNILEEAYYNLKSEEL
ncbi:MAG: LamG-like jellyroll fold domain-containing protein [Promethearchaeota archaeon]